MPLALTRLLVKAHIDGYELTAYYRQEAFGQIKIGDIEKHCKVSASADEAIAINLFGESLLVDK